jgi:hypothetical protein
MGSAQAQRSFNEGGGVVTIKQLSQLHRTLRCGVSGRLACVALVLLTLSCGRDLPLEPPGSNVALYYPTSLALSPDGRTGYIVNTNFNQRFSAGWITSFDVGTLFSSAMPRQALHRQALTPSLGGKLSLSADGLHGFVAHRGSGVLTVLDMQPGAAERVTCSAAGNRPTDLPPMLRRTDCDRAHLVDLIDGMQQVAKAQHYSLNFRDLQDPAPVAYLAGNATQAPGLVVGFLGSGWLASLSTPASGKVAVLNNYALPNTSLHTLAVQAGAQSVGHPTALYATSRRTRASDRPSAVLAFDLAALSPGPAGLDAQPGATTADLAADAGGLDSRGLVQSPDGVHLVAIDRFPDALVVLRRSALPISVDSGPQPLGSTAPLTPAEVPAVASVDQLRVVSTAAIYEGRLTDVLYLPRQNGDLIVASSVDSDTLYFFSLRGDAIALVGRLKLERAQGPYALAQVTVNNRSTLLATTFYDHGLVAIDVSAADPKNFTQLFEVHEDDLQSAQRAQ